jgi:endonuclease YncB( thermonuclease family)
VIMPPVPPPFLYAGQVLEWHDGDSCRVYVDRGMRDYSIWSIRLAGCNAAELGDPGGPEARAEVMRRVPPGMAVTLATVKPDKFGDRLDARVFHIGPDGAVHDLVADLVADGWAAAWNGSGPRPVPPWPRPAPGG